MGLAVIIISTLLILAGLFGLRNETVKGRLLFAAFPVIGSFVLTFSSSNPYLVIGGVFALSFRVIATLILVVFAMNFAKKNDVTKIAELCGVARSNPYGFAAFIILAVITVGFPATGTFTGMVYTGMGLLAASEVIGKVIVMIAFVAMGLSMVVTAALIFPVLRNMYFPEKHEGVKELKSKINVLVLIIAVVLLVLCIWQKPVISLADLVIKNTLGGVMQ